MIKHEIIDGKILSINNHKLSEENKITIADESLILSGMINESNMTNVDVLYLLVDGIPLAKSNNIHYTEPNSTSDLEIEFTFAILKNYLPLGCNIISIAGLSNNNPFIINNVIEICT